MVEQAKYVVLKKNGKTEIRRYPPLVLARVDGYGDGGFNLLFRFISGQNRQKSDIAMTASVVSEQIAMTAPVLSQTGSIAFIMPEGFTLETTLKLSLSHSLPLSYSLTSSLNKKIKNTHENYQVFKSLLSETTLTNN